MNSTLSDQAARIAALEANERIYKSSIDNWQSEAASLAGECKTLSAQLTASRAECEGLRAELAVCPECDGHGLMHGYDADCPNCNATGRVSLRILIRSILDDDDADVFKKLRDIRAALSRKETGHGA